jgi:hypothetical protein
MVGYRAESIDPVPNRKPAIYGGGSRSSRKFACLVSFRADTFINQRPA